MTYLLLGLAFVLGAIVGLVVGTYTAVREQARREAFAERVFRTYAGRAK